MLHFTAGGEAALSSDPTSAHAATDALCHQMFLFMAVPVLKWIRLLCVNSFYQVYHFCYLDTKQNKIIKIKSHSQSERSSGQVYAGIISILFPRLLFQGQFPSTMRPHWGQKQKHHDAPLPFLLPINSSICLSSCIHEIPSPGQAVEDAGIPQIYRTPREEMGTLNLSRTRGSKRLNECRRTLGPFGIPWAAWCPIPKMPQGSLYQEI